MLLSVVSLLVTDYHKTCAGVCLVTVWVQAATSHNSSQPLSIVSCRDSIHQPTLSTPARSAHTDNFTIRHSHNRAQCSGPVPNLILMIGYCWPWILSWTSNIALLKCSLWRYTIRVSFSSLWFRLFYFAASLTSVTARCLPLSAAVMLPGHGTQCSASAISTQPTGHFLPHAQSK